MSAVSRTAKPPLEYEVLTDVIDLALWAGQMLLQSGADAARVEETVHRMGTGLGCDWMDILVSPNVLLVTTISGDQFRTKVRRVPRMGVNMTIVDEINHLSRRIDHGELDRLAVRAELRRIDTLHDNYDRWTVVVMVGLACASFSRLFGADWGAFGVTFCAAAIAQWTRQELHKHHFNTFMITAITAFTAGCVASLASVLELSDQPQLALAASVLLLVPGVPLIHSIEDIIYGHVLIGLTRGLIGAILAMCIALGLLLAMGLMGVSGL
jgi:uncharacterized membrane protein YjjP (DUF1212 family)